MWEQLPLLVLWIFCALGGPTSLEDPGWEHGHKHVRQSHFSVYLPVPNGELATI